MIIEPLIFVIICYWLTGLRSTFYAFGVTAMCVVLVMNVATACGCFFSTAFNSVPLAMAYLVPLDYIFMITSGIFIQVKWVIKLILSIKFVSRNTQLSVRYQWRFGGHNFSHGCCMPMRQ